MPYQKYSSGFLAKRAKILRQIHDRSQQSEVDLILTALEHLKQNARGLDMPTLVSVLEMTAEAVAMDVEAWDQPAPAPQETNVIHWRFAPSAE